MISSIYINNTPQNGKIVNSTGNKLQITLANPIMLNSDKKYQVRLLNANIVYCDPNIYSINNQFKYKYNGVSYTYTVPTGLYSIQNLNTIIGQQTLNTVGNKNVFLFFGDDATSKVYVKFYSVGAQIDCTGSTNVMQIFGFDTSQGLIGGFNPISDA